MARSIAREAAAFQRPELPLPPIPLSPEALGYYAEVLSGLPVQHHRSTVVRTLCTGMAQCMEEMKQASALIDREGLVVAAPQGVKAHPAVGIRDAAAKRMAALASRLKALPQGDAREAQRQAAFETKARGTLPLAVVRPEPTAKVNWAALADQDEPTLIEDDQE